MEPGSTPRKSIAAIRDGATAMCRASGTMAYGVKVDQESGRQLDLLQILGDRIGVAPGLRHEGNVEIGV